MAKFIKHVGQNIQGKKVVVLFREVPGEPENCLVVHTEKLPASYHDDLMRAVESNICQDQLDTHDFLFRQSFQDGTNMLNTLHQQGWIVKVPTKSILMRPTPGVEINLVDLNKELKQITNQEAVQGIKRATVPAAAPSTPPGVISDEQLAAKYRSQANTFEAEVRRLREEANKLDPKSVVAGDHQSPAQPATEAKRGRGRPAKVQVVT
jgi:hypothetical protein